jgi:hypothetical protein
MKMEETECSETLAFKLQTQGNNPDVNIRYIGWVINFSLRRLVPLGKKTPLPIVWNYSSIFWNLLTETTAKRRTFFSRLHFEGESCSAECCSVSAHSYSDVFWKCGLFTSFFCVTVEWQIICFTSVLTVKLNPRAWEHFRHTLLSVCLDVMQCVMILTL